MPDGNRDLRYRHGLDSRAVPAATTGGAVLAESEPDAHNAGDEPDKGGNESKSLSSLPATTGVTTQKAVPVPNASAVELVNGVDEDTEGGEPGEGEDNVNWEQEEAERAGNQPEQGQQYGYASDDFGVDPSRLRPGIDVVELVEVVTDDTGNDSTEENLGHAEHNGYDTRDDRHDEWGGLPS